MKTRILLTQTVTTTQTWADYRSLCGHLTIQNGAKLTISGTTVLPYQANIIVKNNSELIVDNGNVINSNIIVESGGKLTLDYFGEDHPGISAITTHLC